MCILCKPRFYLPFLLPFINLSSTCLILPSGLLDITLIYIVSHHSSREHRDLTKFRHLTRFLASTLTSFHVLPRCQISSRIVLRHVFLGLPRGLVPWGFHSRAASAMSPCGRRSVWPSHPHFPCRISNSFDLCLALAHSPWFDKLWNNNC